MREHVYVKSSYEIYWVREKLRTGLVTKYNTAESLSSASKAITVYGGLVG